jgi:hypothetical protein
MPEFSQGEGRLEPHVNSGHGDIFLARLLTSGHYRWTIYVVLFLNAAISLYYRVGQGGSLQVLPWYGALLAIYFVGLACASRDRRCRAVHLAFAVLVAAAFTRGFFQAHARIVGAVEVATSLVLLAMLINLNGDEAFRREGAVLESPASGHEQEGTGNHE